MAILLMGARNTVKNVESPNQSEVSQTVKFDL